MRTSHDKHNVYLLQKMFLLLFYILIHITLWSKVLSEELKAEMYLKYLLKIKLWFKMCKQTTKCNQKKLLPLAIKKTINAQSAH